MKRDEHDYWDSLTAEQKEKHLLEKEKELGLPEGCIKLCQPYFERRQGKNIQGIERIEKHRYSFFHKCSSPYYAVPGGENKDE